MQSAVETSAPLFQESGHELSVSLPPEPVPLHADPIRLAQVLSNLLNNAAKYTEPGGRVWLTAERRGGEVVVSIRDTGIGIPAAMLPGIFEMFTQVDASLERTHGGLGIGLTLVRRLVELHGGTVQAASAGPGQGSEFTVRLPVLVQEEPPRDQAPQGGGVVLIAVTGWGQEEDKRQAREAGFDLHQVKPLDPALLQELLASLEARR